MKTFVTLVTIACAGWIAGVAAQAQERTARDRSELRVQSSKAISVMAPGRTGNQATLAGQADCRRECQDQVEQQFQGCVDEGGEPAECEAQAGMTLWQCLHDQCEMDLPGAPCEFQCHQRAGYVYDDCIEQGGTPEECGTHGEQAFRECLMVECGVQPEPPQCGAACHELAVAAFNDCMDGGGIEEECYAAARVIFGECIADSCGTDPTGPSCESGCRHESEAQYQECLDTGELPEVCADLAREVLQDCLMTECGHEFPALDSCVHDCHDTAYEMYQSCREDGGTKDVCRAEAVAYLDECLAGCP